MAEVQAGARNRARRRQAVLLGGGPTQGLPLSPAPGEPPTWLASREIANSLGDVQALKRTPVPTMDYMCGRNAQGIQGAMVAQAGVMFCVWEG